jgi:hypothetical protein
MNRKQACRVGMRAVIAALTQPKGDAGEVRAALEVCRDLLRQIVANKGGLGVLYAAANQATHQATTALSLPRQSEAEIPLAYVTDLDNIPWHQEWASIQSENQGARDRATKGSAPKEWWGVPLTRKERSIWAVGYNTAVANAIATLPTTPQPAQADTCNCGALTAGDDDQRRHSADCTIYTTPAAHGVGDGMVVVPREPTQAMFEAGFAATEKQYSSDPMSDMTSKVTQTYRAMIQAASAPGGE